MRKRFLFLLLFFFFAASFLAGAYLLRPGDRIEIFNYGYPDLCQECLVGPDGMVQVRLLGNIPAQGLSTEKLGEQIQAGYLPFAPESRISVIVMEYFPGPLFVVGEVKNPGQLDTVMEGQLSLLEAIGLCGGTTESADLSSVLVTRGSGKHETVDISDLLEKGEPSQPLFLQAGDMVVVPRLYTRRVYVLGDIETSGPVYFESREPMNMETFLSKMQFNQTQMEPKITILRKGLATSVDVGSVSSLASVALESNDVVVVNNRQPRFVYVSGSSGNEESVGRIEFSQEETLSVRTLLGKLGIHPQLVSEMLITPPVGEEKSVSGSDLELFDFELLSGSVVQFPPARYVYVLGNVPQPGKVVFDLGEPMTLATLVGKLGFGMESGSTLVSVSSPTGLKQQFSTTEIRAKDIFLVSGSLVEFPYERFVYALGDVPEGAQNPVVFENNEAMTLQTFLAKLNAIDFDRKVSVSLSRQGITTQYDAQEVLLQTNPIPLQTGDVVQLHKQRDRFVYAMVGEGSLARVEFDSWEELDLWNLLVKLEEVDPTLSNEIRLFFPDGNVQVVEMERVLSRDTNPSLPPKTVVMLPQNAKKAYVFGNVLSPGEIVFKRDEPFTLQLLLVKAGANLGLETGEILLQTGQQSRRFLPGDSAAFPATQLQPGDVVFVRPYQPIQIGVVGQVQNPGVISLARGETPSLLSALARAGGFSENASSMVSLISPEGRVQRVDFSALEDPASMDLENGSYVVVEENTSSFIAVLGDVPKPGIQYVQAETRSLLQVLGTAGGVDSWVANTTVEITRADGSREIVQSLENPAGFSQAKVGPGDIVYVVPSESRKVYVFGEVRSPGIVEYHQNMSLFEAIMAKGGPSSSAYLKKVLFFSGGIEQPPMVVDLSTIKWAETTREIFLEAGDVVYVPKSALVDILTVTDFLSKIISLTSSGITLVDKFK
ncbi:MAG TPA: SLBB domain-containing protein [Thermotogota bacterium]|nr:SLBB domain-containing protein [Thermotogota bacterium]